MDLPNNIEELKIIIISLLAEIERLKAENADLRRRLGLNSENSHKPPGSDGLAKKPAFPREKNKKNGGQKGHKGNTLKRVPNPDIIVNHHPVNCACCGRLFNETEIETIQTRQVFDLPPQKLVVTEHRLGRAWCCGQTQTGVFPAQVTQPAQYGAGVYSLCTLLSVQYRLPQEQIGLLFYDLYGYHLNSTTVMNITETAHDLLEPVIHHIKEKLLAEKVLHFDETGIRAVGKTQWLHTACSENYTHLFVSQSRGHLALSSAQSIIKDFTGYAVHDCWQSYFKFEKCTHIICNAHILRELANLIEQGSLWASQMHDFIMLCYLLEKPPDKIHQMYDEILILAEQDLKLSCQLNGKQTKSFGRGLLRRLRKYKDGILRFAFDKSIPFTNNQAERDIRCAKIKLKVSGGFRSISGANHYARIQSVISTWRKQNVSVFTTLRALFDGGTLSLESMGR